MIQNINESSSINSNDNNQIKINLSKYEEYNKKNNNSDKFRLTYKINKENMDIIKIYQKDSNTTNDNPSNIINNGTKEGKNDKLHTKNSLMNNNIDLKKEKKTSSISPSKNIYSFNYENHRIIKKVVKKYKTDYKYPESKVKNNNYLPNENKVINNNITVKKNIENQNQMRENLNEQINTENLENKITENKNEQINTENIENKITENKNEQINTENIENKITENQNEQTNTDKNNLAEEEVQYVKYKNDEVDLDTEYEKQEDEFKMEKYPEDIEEESENKNDKYELNECIQENNEEDEIDDDIIENDEEIIQDKDLYNIDNELQKVVEFDEESQKKEKNENEK